MTIERISAKCDELRVILDYLTNDEKRKTIIGLFSEQLEELEKCLSICKKYCDLPVK